MRSIQSMVDAAAPGSTVVVPPGIYRETVTIRKPLTLAGQPGAEIRGSDVWTTWTKSGPYWVGDAVPRLSTSDWPSEDDSDNRCRWPEQVFLNGQPLRQVAANPGPGQFALDRNRRVMLADDPAGKTVEVTTRAYWVVGQSDGVTIQGLTMKHAATPAQAGAITNNGFSNWTIQNNNLSHAHGGIVDLTRAKNLRLINNEISYAGQLGVHSWKVSDTLVQGNRIHHNNTEGFSTAWEAGGLKFVEATRLTIDSNEVWANNGPGIWCDIDCSSTTISNNRVHHNGKYGISYEISQSARIFGNKVWENGWQFADWGWGAGILVQNSANTEVFDNVVAWNADGISVISQRRGDSPRVVGNAVHDNAIFTVANGQTNVMALAWLEDWAGGMSSPDSANTGSGNRFWHANPNGAPWPFVYCKDAFSYGDIAGFSRTRGGAKSRYLSATERAQTLSAAGIPTAPESH